MAAFHKFTWFISEYFVTYVKKTKKTTPSPDGKAFSRTRYSSSNEVDPALLSFKKH